MPSLDPIESWGDGLIAALEPAARRALARRLATLLRNSQAKRIGAQRNPDGTPYAPRRPRKKGAIRRVMFSRLRTAKWLKAEGTEAGATLRFADQVQHMAQVHQFGLRDKVNRRTGLEVDYPARQLLGLTDAELVAIQGLILEALAR